MKVATYGTLKKGHGNNRLLAGADFLGEDTVKGYKLYYSGSGAGFPVAVKSEEDTIKVEVYEINEDIRNNLDWLEGYSESAPRSKCLYTRDPVVTSGGIEAEMYIGGECWNHRNMKLQYEVPKNGGIYEWS